MRVEKTFEGWNSHKALSDGCSPPAVLVKKDGEEEYDYGFTLHKWVEAKFEYLAIVIVENKEEVDKILGQPIHVENIEKGEMIEPWLKVFKKCKTQWRHVNYKKGWKYIPKDPTASSEICNVQRVLNV